MWDGDIQELEFGNGVGRLFRRRGVADHDVHGPFGGCVRNEAGWFHEGVTRCVSAIGHGKQWAEGDGECFRDGVVQCDLGCTAASKGMVAVFVEGSTTNALCGEWDDGES